MNQRAAELLKPMPLIPYVRAHLGAVSLKSMPAASAWVLGGIGMAHVIVPGMTGDSSP
jgi:hypothetical protein